jgi:RHS repeat-associated protein
VTATNVYFGSKLLSNGTGNVTQDRLGSIGKFYPWGQEKPSATTNGTEKFTGYFRDSETGLDYAQNRYHQPGMGRFLTADPYRASGGPGDPGSWNRYAYTRGDPVNRYDPTGLLDKQVLVADCLTVDEGDSTSCIIEDFGTGSSANGDTSDVVTDFPDCNPNGNHLTETKLNFISANWNAAATVASAAQSAVQGVTGNNNLTIDTTALATMFLQWPLWESGWGSAQSVAQNNWFGQQVGWDESVTCPQNPAIPPNTKNACFSTNMTWASELIGGLDAISSTTKVSYLDALVGSLAKSPTESTAAMLQTVGANGWNGGSNYGATITSGVKLSSLISCLGLH